MNETKLLFSRILLLVIGGSFFVVVQDWLILPAVASIWLLFEYKLLKTFRIHFFKVIQVGIFLMIFDFILENLGYLLGYWISMQSHLFILYVPIEVMLTCLFGGAAWALFSYPNRGNRNFVIANSVIWSIGGTAGEWFLNLINFMSYGNGWRSLPHAFATYLCTFFILHYLLSKINV
jgi:hypothetical protein